MTVAAPETTEVVVQSENAPPSMETYKANRTIPEASTPGSVPLTVTVMLGLDDAGWANGTTWLAGGVRSRSQVAGAVPVPVPGAPYGSRTFEASTSRV